MTSSRARAGVLALGLLLLVVAPAAAQDTASPFVPAGHWSLDAARRLHGMGLMPAGYDPSSGGQSLYALVEAFHAAADPTRSAPGGGIQRGAPEDGPPDEARSPAGAALAAAYLARLRDEFGDLARPGSDLRGVSSIGFGVDAERGRVPPGVGNERPQWVGSAPLPTTTTPTAAVRHLGAVGRAAFGFDVRVDEDGLRAREAYGSVGLGPWALWAGARPQAYPTAAGGGIVLTELRARPGVGAELQEAIRLPWFLDALGPARFTTALVQGSYNHTLDDPWIWTTRASIEPHPRLLLGINRGIMFGGSGNDDFSLRNLAYLVIGKHAGGFDNQVFSATVRYRPPLSSLPLVATFEWGFEDSAGAWWDVPGYLLAVELPAVPGIPEAAAGLEGTWFAESCCGNPIWYRNWAFTGGWSEGGRPLGHPLGGHGHELRGWTRLDLAGARIQVRGDAFYRERGRENVLAPAREGRSLGGALDAVLFPGQRWDIGLALDLETGLDGDWWEHRVDARVRVRLP